MTALDHFQPATVMIADGLRIAARQELREAIRWIDRTGKDKRMRSDLADLLATLDPECPA